MNRFIRLIAGTPTPSLALRAQLAMLALLAMLAAPVSAQRVQFPTPTQPIDPYAVPAPATTVPAPPASTYPTTPYSPSPYTATPVPTTPYSPAAVGPPPLFDPYASGSTVAPPPPAVPYTPPPPAAAPFATTPPPPTTTPLFPQGSPIQWQPPPYDIATSGESYWEKTQRFLQELSFEYTYLYGKSGDPSDFEVNRVELASTFAFPMFYNTQTPLLVTPGFAFNFLEGPASNVADLPAQVYDAYLDFAWYPRCYEWLGGELGFRTGVWSDFDHVSSDSIRLMGRGLGSVAITPNLDILLGAVYLDRIDVKLLPAGGFYYRPTPEWDMYLVFPNPKVRRFLTAIGNTKWYGYVAGEYGGGSWTAQRIAREDRFDYNDIRVIGGLEWETQSFIRGHVELGYVWDREIIYLSGMPPSFTPDDTIMIRAGIDF